MTRKKWLIALFAMLTFSVACKKEPAVGINENFIGAWKHNIDATHTVYLGINEDSRGNIERYENGNFKGDSQHRKWLIKNRKLYFGWLAAKDEKYFIDLYPTVATSTIIHNLDTIPVGSKYMILDGNYYVD